jgi:vitamin B12 transporter
MNKTLSLAITTGIVASITTIISSNIIAAEIGNKKSEKIVITATRTQQSYAQTLASVTVFTRDDIEKFQIESLAELLTKAAGISITRTGGRGASTGVSLRGNQTDHTLFLVDGARIGSSTLGSSPVELIDPELIERIEIVRGPKSSLYGSDALGGVINIITRRASIKKPLAVKISAGNNNSNDASLSYGKQGDNYQANITASYIYTGGIDNTTDQTFPNNDDDAFRQQSIGFNGNVDINQDINLGLSYQLSEAESEWDNNCTDATSFTPVICSPYSDSKVEALNLAATWDILSRWTSTLSGGFSKDESETLADEVDMLTTFSGGEFNTRKTNINWQNDIQIIKALLLTVGYDYLKEVVDGTTNYDVDERDNDGYYTQLQFSNGPLSANIGGRRDDNEQFGSHNTYNATVGYDISQSIKVIASYGDAFKAPTFNDLYFPFFGDPTLVPEETDSYEIALRGFSENIDWSISAYQNNIENLIQYNSTLGSNDQISSATIKGVELFLEGDFYGWSIATALTLLDTQDDATGNELARRPDKTINIDIDRHFGKWSIGTTLYASSSRYDNATNDVELNGYGTMALRGAYAANDQWKFQLKADNIFDKDYALAQASSFSGLGTYPQPGREVLFSVIYTPKL